LVLLTGNVILIARFVDETALHDPTRRSTPE
jgi:hypothetical protein